MQKLISKTFVRINKAMDATLVPLTPIHKRVVGFAVRHT